MKQLLANGFVLLVPIFIWNLLFTARLPQPGYRNDRAVARWLLVVETFLRIAVFGFPLFLTMQLETLGNQFGLVLYLSGSLLYYGAWLVEIYRPDSRLAAKTAVILAPYYLPLVFMAGIGLMGNSVIYVVLASVFAAAHTYHGLQSFGYLVPPAARGGPLD